MTRNRKNELGIHKELWKSIKFWSWPRIMLRFALCDVKFQILVSGFSVSQLLEKGCIRTMRMFWMCTVFSRNHEMAPVFNKNQPALSTTHILCFSKRWATTDWHAFLKQLLFRKEQLDIVLHRSSLMGDFELFSSQLDAISSLVIYALQDLCQ